MSGPTKSQLEERIEQLNGELTRLHTAFTRSERELDATEDELRKERAEKRHVCDLLDIERTTTSWLAYNWRHASERFRAIKAGLPDPHPQRDD